MFLFVLVLFLCASNCLDCFVKPIYCRLFNRFHRTAEDFEHLEKRGKTSKSKNIFERHFWESLFDDDETEVKKDESDLIARIKEDIITVKELGLWDLLIKEVGPALFENKEEIYKPSRLIMDENFKIFLPDFDNMEIEMTPLPKTLFILFLRHTDGILFKQIHDYKEELLEIYKLLSYKEDFFDIVESIDRICNPTDGSINEKISRIKEAFIKKMSIDTAKYYIVTGERGQKKEIPLNRSFLQLPSMFEEIIMTGIR